MEFVVAMLAVWRVGGRVAVINHLLTAGKLSLFHTKSWHNYSDTNCPFALVLDDLSEYLFSNIH